MRPWIRRGFKVLGRFENDEWIKMDGSEGEWAVAFHGFASPEFVLPKILNEGLRVGIRNLHGRGIYCSPKIEVAEEYGAPLELGRNKYHIVL